jgi:hypothetical protein
MFLLAIACVQTGVNRLQEAPVIEFVTPEAGSTLRQGAGPIDIQAIVTDEYDLSEDLVLEWVVDTGEPVDGGNPAADGSTSWSWDIDGLSLGEHALTLRATDTDGVLGYGILNVIIAGPVGAPEVVITAPEDGTITLEGAEITFRGEATDNVTEADELDLWWTSDLQADIDADAVTGGGKSVLITAELIAGTHLITLHAIDGDGDEGQDSITVKVGQDPPVDAQPGDLVFSEMMVNPEVVEDDQGEWVELYNTSGYAIDVGGYVFRDDDYDYYELVGPIVVQPNDYMVLCANLDLNQNGGVPCDGFFFRDYQGDGLALANREDEVVLVRPDGVEIDWLHYGDTWFTNGMASGVDPAHQDAGANNDGANWCIQTTVISAGGEPGTPGMENDPC